MGFQENLREFHGISEVFKQFRGVTGVTRDVHVDFRSVPVASRSTPGDLMEFQKRQGFSKGFLTLSEEFQGYFSSPWRFHGHSRDVLGV